MMCSYQEQESDDPLMTRKPSEPSQTDLAATSQHKNRDGSLCDNTLNKLLTWMAASGFNLSSCHLAPFDFIDTGRGLMANKNIHAGDLLIEVPQSLIITSRTVMDSYLREYIKRSRLTPLAAICVFLVCERCRGKLSPWHPYLASLPQTYTIPVYWSNDLVDRLPSAIKQEVIKQKSSVFNLYKRCRKVFVEVQQTREDLKNTKMDLECFVWAWSTVNTRCVYWLQKSDPDLEKDGENHYALVPFLDLLNHSHHAEVEASYDDQSMTYRVKTNTPYSLNQQVFINYGPHSDMKLLVEYGFILKNNPNNAIEITESEFMEALEDKKDDAYLCFIHTNVLHKGHALSKDGLTWSLHTALKVAALQDLEDKSKHKSYWHRCLEENYYVSEHHNEATNFILLKLLRNKIKQFHFEVKNHSHPIEEMIGELCRNHKQIIESCLPAYQK